MISTRLVSTSAGTVEILHVPGEEPPVLFFPGGHCRAATDCGWGLYAGLGHETVSFSRPGYGGTRVGPLTAAEFTPLVGEVCEQLRISRVAAAVGVSFGGLQAVHIAAGRQSSVRRLILHSCAPSSLPYPDTRAEALLGPLAFSPLLEALVWGLIRGVVRTDAGLRMMMSQLSILPVSQWWDQMSVADKEEARSLFRSMRSDSGFANDLRQGHPEDADARHEAIASVQCRTLVTASRHDGGVSLAHAEDFVRVIPNADLVELDSASHLFWIGSQKAQLTSTLASFIRD